MKKRILSGIFAVLMVLSLVSEIRVSVRAVSAMEVSSELLDVLKLMEGFNVIPQWDYSQWTVGYGTRCPADKLDYYLEHGITEQEATELLHNELTTYTNAVNNYATTHGLTLKQQEFDALVSFSYNCGSSWMRDTDSLLNVALQQGGTASDIIYSLCLYSMAGGEYILVERRLHEANMYLNGVYKAYNKNPEAKADSFKYVFLDGNGGTVHYVICGYDANLNSPIPVEFTSIPAGTDSQGNGFIYELAGWYTADGRKVETLDSTLKDGQVLYARWTDPEGNVATIPQGKPEELTVTVTGDSVNVRTGPATYYEKVSAYPQGTEVAITATIREGSYTWGKTDQGWFRLDYSNYEELIAGRDPFPKSGTVTGDGVNVRVGPGTSYTRVGQKNKGDRVTITEEAEGGSYRWGKMEDGNWICLDYVRYDTDVRRVTGITLLHPPEKTEYVQKSENLKLDGSVLMLHYEDGTASAMTLTAGMISGFTNDELGEVTVQVNYGGYTASFTVTIIKATVTFRSGDGTVLSSAQYAYGETVVEPEEVLPWESEGKYYVFNGWDKEVTPCNGNAVYTATYIESERPEAIPQSMTSEAYTLAEGYIRKIPAGTTVEALMGGINEKDYIAVYAGGEPVDGTAVVSTGMTVNLEHKGTVIQSVTVIVTGDVNGDGEISITDMINIKSHILEKAMLTDAYAQAADLNNDGAVSITDFVQIKAYLLGNGNITEN